MLKNKLLPIFLGASLVLGSGMSLASQNEESSIFESEQSISNQDLSFTQKIEALKKELGAEFFTNQAISEEDLETQEVIIKALDRAYFSKKTLNKEEKFELFSQYVRNIIHGYNDAAEAIWEYSLNNDDFNIDLSYYSKSNITPLMAASISSLEGGNVEYLIKLIERGAVPDQTTIKNKISPISMAATEDNYKALTTLIVAGANPMHKDSMGLTAYDYAKKHESEKSMFILLNLFMKMTEPQK